MANAQNHLLQAYQKACHRFQIVGEMVCGASPPSSAYLAEMLESLAPVLETIEVDDTLHYISLCQMQQQLKILLRKLNAPAQTPPSLVRVETKRKIGESALSLDHLKRNVKSYTLDDIIGQNDVKKTLKSVLILPKFQPQIFHTRRLCNTILLYGPPGTGKTKLVNAIASEARAQLFCISTADILSPFIGQTEKTLKQLFANLKQATDLSILFIDEIDGICRKRTDREQDYTRRIKTELMCQLSEVEETKQVFVMAATNCPWELDTAILRRFQKRVYVRLPNECERLEMLRYFLGEEQIVARFSRWEPVVRKTKGYSGSDLNDLAQYALNMPVEELEETKIWRRTPTGCYEPVTENCEGGEVLCADLGDLPPKCVRTRPVTMADLLLGCEFVQKTISMVELVQFEAFNRN